MLKIKDIIEKLQELNDDDYTVELEVEPIINCIELACGTSRETTKYRYIITLEGNEKTREYKNEHGIKKYLDKKGE